jgi:hypothetical protein
MKLWLIEMLQLNLILCLSYHLFQKQFQLVLKKILFYINAIWGAQLHLIHEKFDVILDYLALIFP